MQLSKSWRSLPNRRLSHGSHDREIPGEGIPLSEVRADLSNLLRETAKGEIVITRHGKPAGLLIGFETEDD
ncbi:MAG: hypothetical protein QOF91_241 [Alphaproteobacteria bacterium]|jgi:prevent-host-death family protein|nr:hypothetical protein [Alphaproteobacteria bacterium]